MIHPLLLLAVQATTLPADAPDCHYDRTALLALDEQAFDQDQSGGWRALAARDCEMEAADLIRDYRATPRRLASLLTWHEGQLRANAGQTAQAIALFDQSRKSAAEDAGFGWNLYVDGSIAFLRRDRAALTTARDRLAALPRPADFPTDMIGADGKRYQTAWPMNLKVLDGFLRCFGTTYKAAYSCPAQPSITPADKAR